MDEEIAAFLDAAAGALTAAGERVAGLPEKELLDVLRRVEEVFRRTYAVSARAVAEVEHTRFAVSEGYPSTVRLLEHLLHLSRGEALRRVEDAARVGPRRAMTGQPLRPMLPHAAAALADGRLGLTQLRVIAEILDQVPDRVPVEDRDAAEATLVEYAERFGPAALNRLGHRILDALDPDGPAPGDDGDEEGRPAPPPVVLNSLTRDPQRHGGKLTGRFDDEAWATITTLLNSLNTPRPAAEGRDMRTCAQRDADALIEAAHRLLDAGDLPTAGGERPHLTLTVPLEVLTEGIGRVQLDAGGSLDAGAVRRLACDARIVPVVLGTGSEPLDVGRASRTVPQPLRRALVARDRGCAFPGCAAPAAWCHAHHLRAWEDGGPTSLDNLVLLCGQHHRLVHHSPWEVRMTRGHPEFLPPDWLDPERRPRTNPLRE